MGAKIDSPLGRKFSGFSGSSGSRPWGAEEPAGAGQVGLERWVIVIDRPDRRDGLKELDPGPIVVDGSTAVLVAELAALCVQKREKALARIGAESVVGR